MKSLTIAQQSRRPSGLLGHLVAHGMARDTAACNDRALHYLDVQSADRVIEIGSGHGRTIQRIAALAPDGFVAGIDFSSTMHAVATRKNRREIRAGRVHLTLGDSAALPYGDAEFDKALTVHTIYFWVHPAEHLREIARVLKPGGRLVLCFRPNDDGSLQDELPAAVYFLRTTDAVRDLLRTAGFTTVDIETWTNPRRGTPYAYAIAQK